MKMFARFFPHMAVLIFLTRFAAPASAGVVFNFDSDPVGTSTPFTNTVGTLEATFSGPNAGVCDVSPLRFVLQSGNAFISDFCVGTATPPFVPLGIAFNQNVYGITMDFAISGTDTLVLTALENGAVVGTASSSGSVLSGGTFPEGILGFSGTFNSVSLSTSGTPISIDNVNVQNAAAIPEPAGLAWLGCAFLGFAVRWRKR
jgi:hypothetical protein